MNLLKLRKGFTLIELLVVIAIIGILASLIIVSLTGANNRARDTQRKNNARNLDSALAQYYVDNANVYPGDGVAAADTGVAIAAAGSCTGAGALSALFGTSGYITSTTACNDPSTNARFYASSAVGNSTSYQIAWQLSNQSEANAPSGNGIYTSTAGGVVTAGGLNNTTGVASTKHFVVFGPQ